MSRFDDLEEDGSPEWLLSVRGVPVDKRLTSDGVVGVFQPLLLIEASAGMTDRDELNQWQTFISACARDTVTGDRLLVLRIELPSCGRTGFVEVTHPATTHTFDVPEVERASIEQISKLATVPVIYGFRSQPQLSYRAVIANESASARNLDGEGAELWISPFGRGHQPKAHINAMRPVSRNFVEGTSSSDVFTLDLTTFKMPASDNCVICAQPLAGTSFNREHIVPDWLRSLVADELEVPVDGIVADAHTSCNDDHGPGENAIRTLTVRHLAGDDLTGDELGAVAYWMTGRMVLLDRAIGIEVPTCQPLDSAFKSTRIALAPIYSGRLGDEDDPPFRTLVMGPWIYHLCWTADGCGDASAE